MTKYAVLFSSMAVLTLSLTETASAMVSLPNVSRCFAQAATQADIQRCEALRNCVNNQSDDQASLQGCLALTEDAYVVQQGIGGGTPLVGNQYGGAMLPGPGGVNQNVIFAANTEPVLGWGGVLNTDGVEVESSNSELVWGIQGDKGFTNQQEGPND